MCRLRSSSDKSSRVEATQWAERSWWNVPVIVMYWLGRNTVGIEDGDRLVFDEEIF